MPINYHQIQKRIPGFCESSARHQQSLLAAIDILLEVMAQSSQNSHLLGKVLHDESSINKSLRCARPLHEPPNIIQGLSPYSKTITLIAADGSQINPNRHRRVNFSLINIATICIQTDSNATPIIDTESILMHDYDFEAGQVILTDNIIALERDIRERKALLDHAQGLPPPLLTLTDGPLELFRETGDAILIEKRLNEYLAILTGFYDQRIMTAGYVDKPQSDLVTRLLKLGVSKVAPGSARDRTDLENFRVPDATLFSSILRKPGDRSSVFAIHSPWSKRFQEDQTLCFFYMNVSQTDEPYLARVELPAWCASSKDLIDTLQAVVFHQCEIMGSRPYPYILHRAHEIALVTYEETTQLDAMLAARLQEYGIPAGRESHKQSAKDLPGRGSYA